MQLDESNPEVTTKIGALLTPELRAVFEKILRENSDVFAWSHENMPSIDPDLMAHTLNVDLNHNPVQ